MRRSRVRLLPPAPKIDDLRQQSPVWPSEVQGKCKTPTTPSSLDPPDADAVYADYLETCKRTGVEPVPREHAVDLIAKTVGDGRIEPAHHALARDA